MEKTLETSRNIESLKGVGKSTAKLLQKLSIRTLGDLLLHLPRRFLDRRNVTPVSELVSGREALVAGRIISLNRRPRGRGPSLTALFSDDTGALTLTFFRSGFPGSKLREGMEIIACGTVEQYRGFNMVHPELYFTDESRGAAQTPGMLPVYRLTAGLTQARMRKLVNNALEEAGDGLAEILPDELLGREGFASRLELYRAAHKPVDPGTATTARDLVAMEELYLHRSILQAVRERGAAHRGIPLPPLDVASFAGSLPWPLTEAQERVCREVSSDMSSNGPMRRLIQGDVGSGKTVIAAFACHAAIGSGLTAAVLAPTEVLACQHLRSLRGFLGAFGDRVFLLTGGTSPAERERVAGELRSDPAAVVVGTHAILEDWVPLDRLGLLVIDEQHRFGVAQREKLLADREPRPHALVMSATPIPRTLAMTFYGDLDLSVLDTMPSGRGSTRTRLVRSEERPGVFAFMLERLREGERVFLVYPLKESSKNSDLLDATTAFEKVMSGPMARYGAGLLHGSMPPAEKLSVTERFGSGEIGVLVSTTVIEVGIDVPEATVMVIANAERFGLSQLHQLRGRVGRGGRDAWCFLVPGENASPESMERLQVLASTSDGFEVAEMDLRSRGPGQVLGTAQHGIPEFRVADLSIHGDLVRTVNALDPMPVRKVRSILPEEMWRYGGIDLPGV